MSQSPTAVLFDDECTYCDGLIHLSNVRGWFSQTSGFFCQNDDNLNRPHMPKTYVEALPEIKRGLSKYTVIAKRNSNDLPVAFCGPLRRI